MKREIFVMDNGSLPLQLLRFSDPSRRRLVIQHSRLFEGPSKEAGEKVHKEAHGLTADEIFEVEQGE